MPQEIKGLENSIPIRMVYTDTMEEVLFKSAAAASRKTKIASQVIRESLLKTIKEPLVDPETGEMIYPAPKFSTTTFKISLKK
jgi:hypothetical protein